MCQEVRATPVLEKKPLLRLVCPKPWSEESSWALDVARWARRPSTFLTSQLALLQLDMLREVRLETGRNLGISLLRHLSEVGVLRSLVRLEAPMFLVEWAVRSHSTELPALTDLSIRMEQRKGKLAEEFAR